MTEINEKYLKNLSDKTLIIDRKEYIMTGRIAKKSTGYGSKEKYMIEVHLREVEPSPNFLIWVDPKDIYVVE